MESLKIFHSDVSVQRLQNHSNVKNVIKLCVHQDVRCLKSQGSIQEVKKSCSRRATLTHPLVRSNLPRASYLDECLLAYDSIAIERKSTVATFLFIRG